MATAEMGAIGVADPYTMADFRTMAGFLTIRTLIDPALGGECPKLHSSVTLLISTVRANRASDVYAVAALLLAPGMKATAAMVLPKKAHPCVHATEAEAGAAIQDADANPAASVGLTTGLALATMDMRLPEVEDGLKIRPRGTLTRCPQWAIIAGLMLSMRPPICAKVRFFLG